MSWGLNSRSLIVLAAVGSFSLVLGQACTGGFQSLSPSSISLLSTGSGITGSTPAATVTPSPAVTLISHVPTGVSGNYNVLIDATFGTDRADATVTGRRDLDQLAYYWFIFGNAGQDPSYWTQSGEPSNCMGPSGDGTDGLYGNFISRFMHCDPGFPWDRHVMGTDRLTLKGNCGLTDGNANNCAAGNIAGGMLRFSQSFRPTLNHPVVIEMKGIMPKGMYSWPAFWLNPGEQAPRNADGSPGAVLSSAWPPEVDIFDEYGFNNTLPGHYLFTALPSNGNDAPYASPLCASQGLNTCDLPATPGGPTLYDTSVATFSTSGWYALSVADLTADWHIYSAVFYTDHIDFMLDGVIFRSKGFTWPVASPPAHLILSNQIGAEFNDISGINDQGGAPNGWDWNLSYVRVWQQQ